MMGEDLLPDGGDRSVGDVLIGLGAGVGDEFCDAAGDRLGGVEGGEIDACLGFKFGIGGGGELWGVAVEEGGDVEVEAVGDVEGSLHEGAGVLVYFVGPPVGEDVGFDVLLG